MSQRICDLCSSEEGRTATVECIECGKSLDKGEDPAHLCDFCLDKMHSTLGKFAATHHVTSIALQELKETARKQLESMKQAIAEYQSGRMEGTAALIDETRRNSTSLQAEVKASLDELRELINKREKDMLSTIAMTEEYKIRLLSEQRDLHARRIEEANKLVESAEEQLTQQPSEDLHAVRESIEAQLAHLHEHQNTLPSSLSPSSSLPLPSPLTNTSCGFSPNTDTIRQSLNNLLTLHREESQVGDKMAVVTVGQLSVQGTFWVRILPDARQQQVVMLQSISTAVGVELSISRLPPLSSPHPGQLCCVRYSQDQRWYRGKIESISKTGRANVFFLDYGNCEDVAVTTLAALHPKFQVFPFQMLQCSFTDDSSVAMDNREVRWSFTDLTHNRHLAVTVLKHLPGNVLGPIHVVRLLDDTYPEAFDVGATIVAKAEASSGARQPHLIPYRDIRYKNQPAKPPVQPKPGDTQPAGVPPKAPPTQVDPSTGATQQLVAAAPAPGMAETSSEPASKPETAQSHGTPQSDATSAEATPEPPGEKEAPAEDPRPQLAAGLPVPGSMPEEDRYWNETPTTTAEEGTPQWQPSEPPPPESEKPAQLEKPKAAVKPLKIEPLQSVSDSQSNVAGGTETKEPVDSGFDVVSAQDFKPDVPSSESTHTSAEASDGTVAEPSSTESVGEESAVLPPEIKVGAEVQLEVVTEMTSEGCFWTQLRAGRAESYSRLMERLQKQASEMYTPVFFSSGDLCIALYSDDRLWYRALVEKAEDGVFTVRFMDYGNEEERRTEHLAPLSSEFRQLPFQAVRCSMATGEHPTFSQLEMDKFDEVIPYEEEVTAKVLKVVDSTVHVQLFLKVDGKTAVDLNEEIYTADVRNFQSMDFSLHKKERTCSIDDPMFQVSKTLDWAAHMDELNSPSGDGLFTLSGVESDPGSAGTATPPQRLEGEKGQGAPRDERPHSEQPSQERRREPRESEAQRRLDPRTNQTRDERQWVSRRPRPAPQGGGPAHKGGGPAHRLDVGAARRNILANIGGQRSKERLQEPEQQRRARSAEVMVSEGRKWEKVESRVPPVDYGHQLVSGSLGEQWDSPPGSPTAAPKGQRSPDAGSSQLKLFVKPLPDKMTRADTMELFSRYGTVHVIDRSRETLYITMDSEGGEKAMAALDGKPPPGYFKPLVVQRYRNRRSPPSSPSRQRLSGSLDNLSEDHAKLFVKPVPPGMSEKELHALFSKHGKVHKIVPHYHRKNVIYVYMDTRGSQRAINALHGKAIAKNSAPLMVAVSSDPGNGLRRDGAKDHSSRPPFRPS